MENFELIEKYLAGQLQGPAKDAFESQLQTDPSLQSDVALQQQIIEGIKKARITELKTMLSQVPVAGLVHTGVSAVKIITGAVTAGAIVTGTIFFFKPAPKESAAPVIENEVPAVPDAKTEPDPIDPREDKASTPTTESGTTKEKQITKKAFVPKAKKATRPKIEVIDPTRELAKEPIRQQKVSKPQSVIVTSRIGVDINSSSSKYSFHYQFVQGKLILFGIFDNGLYEIIEVNGDTHSIFLYYKDNYYLLDEKQSTITPLTVIKDTELVKKLNEYRGR
jgi:hypothetical protein